MANWWDNPLAENPMGYNALQEMEAASNLNTSNEFPEGTDRLQSGLDVAALVPGVGDIAGPLADLRMMQQNPEQRTLANIALFGLGALPAIPSLAFLMSRGGGLSRAITPFSNESGVIGYHGTRSDYPTNEIYPLSHFGTRPQAANERLGFNPDGTSVMYPEIIQDFLTSTPENSAFKYLIGENIKRTDLNIKKPLRINDHGSGHKTILEHLMLSREAKGITQKEYDALTNIYNTYYKKSEALAEEKTREALIKNLESKGYDGFVYKNDYEDQGRDSLMPFRNSQITDAYGRESKYGTYDNYHHLGKYRGDEKFVRSPGINAGNYIFYKDKPYEIFDVKTGKPFGTAKTPEEAKKLIQIGSKQGYLLDYENVYEEYMKANKGK